MYIDEILHTCSNPHVAKAAVRSSIGLFREAVEARAQALRLDVGDYVAAFVRSFAMQAQPRDRQDMVAAIQAKDQPVLAGLKYILQDSAIEPDFAHAQGANTGSADKKDPHMIAQKVEGCLWC